MQLHSDSFMDGAAIAEDFAFAKIATVDHVALSRNRNPHFAWRDAPAGTRSFALICHDIDVPSSGEDVNRPDREVPASLARDDFFHWLLWEIPADVHEIAAGSHSDGVTPRGKPGPTAPGGMRHGINDYTGWFASDKDMAGTYYGYDGPAPPWNDALEHHYLCTVYALDVARLDVSGEPTGANLRGALEGHVLAQAQLGFTYTLNPRLRSG